MAMRREMEDEIHRQRQGRGRGVVSGYTAPSGWCDPMNERGKRRGARGGSRQERQSMVELLVKNASSSDKTLGAHIWFQFSGNKELVLAFEGNKEVLHFQGAIGVINGLRSKHRKKLHPHTRSLDFDLERRFLKVFLLVMLGVKMFKRLLLNLY